MVKFLKEKTDLTRISSVLSLFTLVAFHWPFFRLVLGNIEGGFNGVLITGGLGVLSPNVFSGSCEQLSLFSPPAVDNLIGQGVPPRAAVRMVREEAVQCLAKAL